MAEINAGAALQWLKNKVSEKAAFETSANEKWNVMQTALMHGRVPKDALAEFGEEMKTKFQNGVNDYLWDEFITYLTTKAPAKIARIIAEGCVFLEDGTMYRKKRMEAGASATNQSVGVEKFEGIERERPFWKVTVDLPEGTEVRTGDVLGIFVKNYGKNLDDLKSIFEKESGEKFKFSHGNTKESFQTQEEAREGVEKDEALKRLRTTQTNIGLLRVIYSKIEGDLEAAKANYGEENVAMLKELLALYALNDEESAKALAQINVIDVLKAFSKDGECLLSLQEVINAQGRESRRVYTVEGAQYNEEGLAERVTLTVASSDLQEGAYFSKGRKSKGAAVSYIESMAEKDVEASVFVQPRPYSGIIKELHDITVALTKAKNVGDVKKLLTPAIIAELQKPILMVCAGTGVAGIKKALDERAAFQRTLQELSEKNLLPEGITPDILGKVQLVYGMQNEKLDYLFKKELEALKKDGVIEGIHLVESRNERGKRKLASEVKYVQNYIKAQGEIAGSKIAEIIEATKTGKSSVQVCGDAAMGNDLEMTLIDMIVPKEEIEAKIAELGGETAGYYYFMDKFLEGWGEDSSWLPLKMSTSGTNHGDFNVERFTSAFAKAGLSPEDLIEGATQRGADKPIENISELLDATIKLYDNYNKLQPTDYKEKMRIQDAYGKLSEDQRGKVGEAFKGVLSSANLKISERFKMQNFVRSINVELEPTVTTVSRAA